MIVSDYLDESLDEFFRVVKLFRHRRFEVLLFHIVHPEELTLPQGRAVQFYDPETSAELNVDPQDVEKQYAAGMHSHLRHVRNLATGNGCEYELIDTTMPYPDAIRAYLRARQAVKR